MLLSFRRTLRVGFKHLFCSQFDAVFAAFGRGTVCALRMDFAIFSCTLLAIGRLDLFMRDLPPVRNVYFYCTDQHIFLKAGGFYFVPGRGPCKANFSISL